MLSRIISCFFLLVFSSFYLPTPADEKEDIAKQMEKSLHNDLLNKFYPLIIDKQDGGFLSGFTYNWKPTGDQDKMIVSQSRHIWTPAKAANFYPNTPLYKTTAQHGYTFLRDVMWDEKNGG